MNKKLRVEIEIDVDRNFICGTFDEIRKELIKIENIKGVRLVETKQYNRERGWLSYGWNTTIDTTQIWVPLSQGEEK